MARIARSRISDGSRTNTNAGGNLHHAFPAPIMITGTAHEVAFAAGRTLDRSGVFFCLAAAQTKTAAELVNRAEVG